MISIVITTYNRIHCVNNAIQCAIEFLENIKKSEIIIVDDCSTDNTFAFLTATYAQPIQAGFIKLTRHTQNRGVTAAKNSGAALAKQEWILFLDSDDTLIPANQASIVKELNQLPDSIPLVFFRCIDQNSIRTGKEIQQSLSVNLNQFIRYGTYGESLPVVRAVAFHENPYLEKLKGFEGIAYFRIIRKHGNAILSPQIARIYQTQGKDRLCERKNLMQRSCLIAQGYWIALKENYRFISPSTSFILLSKLILNAARCLVSKIIS